jgi:hypothetical protein
MLRTLLRNRLRVMVSTLGLLTAFGGFGCAAGRMNRAVSPSRTDDSTLGTDMMKAPKGTTIPPAGFGVDLVSNDTPASL